MNRRGMIRRGVALLLLLLGAASPARAQAPAPAPPAPAPGPAPAAAPVAAPGTGADYPLVPPDVQVVRLQAPAGVRVEVLGPAPEAVPSTDPSVIGLRVGTTYRLRVFNLPNRPGAEVFPVVEVVGHLHRPLAIDPGRFPIRVIISEVDLTDALDQGRLVTQAVYLEDPEQAVPLSLPKDEIPVATLTPVEDPAKVASALGRVMAIVRIGGRTPGPDELTNPDGLLAVGPTPCPFSGAEGGRCALPCGPARGVAPPPGRPWLPRDEYLCDGGERAGPASFGGDGSLRGIDPRDAVIQFRDDRRARVLPTNVVCIYAPRFAAVRTSVGPLQAEAVQPLRGIEALQAQVTTEARQGPRRLVKNETAEINRHRSRASSVQDRIRAGEEIEIRVLAAVDVATPLAGTALVQGPETRRSRQKGAYYRVAIRPLGIKSAESAVVTGIVEGAAQQVMAWRPQETVGVELPPNRPGLAVVKRVSAGVAEPGDVVDFVIQYRNMGNVPITAVSVVDSLLPRLEYVARSARGPAGTVFSAGENRAGGTELRWDLPGALAPGQEGLVSFRARVR